MANVTLYPMIDWYRTTLSQQYTWGTGSIYVNSVPWFTFPWGTTTMVTINAGKSNQQVVIIDGYNSSNKTLNVSSTTVSKWEWVNYTAQTHNVGSEVIISDNFFFWEKLVDAINSKVNSDGNSDIAWGNVTFSWDTTKYGISVKSLTTTQRDALSSPPDWVIIYNITSWVFQKREWWAWSDFGSWSVSNASTTVSGKVEKATSGEVTAGTSTGWTGAELFVWPSELKTVTDWLTSVSVNAGENLTAWDVAVIESDWSAYKTTRKILTPAQISTVTGIDSGNWQRYLRTLYLDTDKAVVLYKKSADNIIYWRVVTFARTIITVWNETTISTATSAWAWFGATWLSTTLFVITFYKNSNTFPTAIACSVSWTTITVWAEATISAAAMSDTTVSCVKVSATSFLSWHRITSTGYYWVTAHTISWTTITSWSVSNLEATAGTASWRPLFSYVSDGVVWTVYDTGAGNYKFNMLTISGTTITIKTVLDLWFTWPASYPGEIFHYIDKWKFLFGQIGDTWYTQRIRFHLINVKDQWSRTTGTYIDTFNLLLDYDVSSEWWLYEWISTYYLGNQKIALLSSFVLGSDVRLRIFDVSENSMRVYYDNIIAWSFDEVHIAPLNNNKNKIFMLYRDSGSGNLNYSLYWNTEDQLIGIVKTTTTAWNSVPIVVTWPATKSWLTTWQQYFVDDAWAISTTGTKIVWVASTSSTIVLK